MDGGRRTWTALWSHNDEDRRRPLLDALEQGAGWIEPDVWVVGEDVLVGHDRPDPSMSLREVYLEPLRQRHDDLDHFYLVLDVKSAPDISMPVIERTLAAYDDVLTHATRGTVVRRPVTVLLSGTLSNRVALQADSVGMTYDGRLGNVPDGASPEWMPLVSASWRDHFWWRGVGPMLPRDQRRLRELVTEVHEAGLRLRFWSLPEWAPWWRRRLWTTLLDAGVDVITTDRPEKLGRLLRAREAHQEVSRGRPSS
ncbi:hypothetical protein [Luteipulveratus mongoliensis]|uniref:hypothetical protein n=1 Tax=Luteipulveratus mongoliensis TaxID=571913 RepID=UPI000696BEC8|nr:hypothetical protein [Luteipulveratus mongoliensis]